MSYKCYDEFEKNKSIFRNDLEREAAKFAEDAHWYRSNKQENRFRKFNPIPYISHPIAVASKLIDLNFDSDTVCAALMHDTIEDTNVTKSEIKNRFNDNIATLVWMVTNQATAEDGNRKQRTEINHNHIRNNANYNAKCIKLADINHNSSSIITDDPNFAVLFVSEKNKLLNDLLDGHPVLVKELQDIIQNYYFHKGV